MSARTVSLQDISSLTTGDATESSHEPGVAVVISCLNEQATIAEAVADADLTYDFREGSKLLPALLDDDADRLPEVYPLPAVHGDGHRIARDEYLSCPSPEAGLGGTL